MLFDFARGTIQRRGTARNLRVLDSARERNKTGKFLEILESRKKQRKRERDRKREKREREKRKVKENMAKEEQRSRIYIVIRTKVHLEVS